MDELLKTSRRIIGGMLQQSVRTYELAQVDHILTITFTDLLRFHSYFHLQTFPGHFSMGLCSIIQNTITTEILNCVFPLLNSRYPLNCTFPVRSHVVYIGAAVKSQRER